MLIKFRSVLLILLILLPAIAFAFFLVFPLFTSFFIDDDLIFLGLGAQLKSEPLSFLTFTYGGWWRPLGFSFTAFLYLIFGFHPFPFHLTSFIAHLLAGFVIYLLAGRLFEHRMGLVAAALFIISPSIMPIMGYVSFAWLDELATTLILLALYIALCPPLRLDKNFTHFLFPGLLMLLASFCKESWVGFLPAFLFIDLKLFVKSTIVKRLVRLLPIGLPALFLPLRFLIPGIDAPIDVPITYANTFFSIENLTSGLVLPFLANPFGDEYPITIFILLVLPTLAFFFFYRSLRDWHRFLILATSFILSGILLAFSYLGNNYWGWLHLTPLVALASILISYIIVKGFRLKKVWLYPVIVAYLGVFLYGVFQSSVTSREVLLDYAQKYKAQYQSFAKLIGNLPEDAHIFGFANMSPYLANDVFIKPPARYTCVRIKAKRLGMGSCNGYMIEGNLDYVRNCLMSYAESDNNRFMILVNDLWCDKTEEISRMIKDKTRIDYRAVYSLE